MALVIEDGSGKENAQSYVSLTDVTNYATLYGLNAAGITEAAIMRAMQFIEGNYRTRWIGIKKSEEQALSWPRSWAIRDDGWAVKQEVVPVEVKNATCALAIRAISENLSPDVGRSDFAEEEQVGPIKVKYAEIAPAITLFRDVEIILRPVVKPRNSARVIRT